ncbi:MAG TPA: chloride channel protein, partial [Bryobacteraceae bacterium]
MTAAGSHSNPDYIQSSGSPAAVRIYPHEEKILLVLTLIIGALVGLVVVAFIVLTENLGARLYPAGGAAWRRLVIPFVGALGTGFFLFRYFPNARGSGIPQTKAALFLRDGYISFRTVLGKFGLCSVSLASGIALGREGPSVHVGSGLASVLGRRLGLSPASVKALVPVGASAALAAAFNTPIAAVLFSLEEVMGDMHAPVLGSIVLSSATSWIVLHLVLGDEPLFHVPAYQLVHPLEFVFYAVLGVVGGIVSVAFVKLLLWQRKLFLALPKSTQWFQPAIGGLTVGILGWFFPDVLGVGYGVVSHALNGQILIGTMALLVCLKIVATATCYSSGNAGGIFGPSLFMGAMMGGAVGGVAHLLMPDYTGSVGAYALVGMGAAFAGVVRVPLTSVIMIFEVTRDYSIIVPLMIANLLSYFISSRLQEEPIYEALQHQDGIHLPSGARAREALLTVGHAFRPNGQVLLTTERVSQAAGAVERDRGAWPVVDARGLRGMITAGQLEEAIGAGRGEEVLGQLVPDPGPIDSLTEERFPHTHTDHPLDVAMRRLAESDLAALPVVSRTDVRELKGTVSVADIVAAYRIGTTPVQPSPAAAVGARTLSRLLAGVVAAIIGVAVLTTFLNYYYRAERVSRAERYFKAGNELVQHERYEEAVEQYRDALSISHSAEHRLALGLALVRAGRLNEAAIYLNEVLRGNPGSGPANVGLARVYAQQGNLDSAVLHYQRAIYGSWPEKPDENRFQTRIELVEALWKGGRKTQAQAELLATAAAVPNDPRLQKQVGRMLIDFGLPRNAADLYRDLVQHDSRDPGAYDGLGDAEFGLGDYAAAQAAYREALKLDPSDHTAAGQVDLCDRILALDPTLRGLTAPARLERSRAILSGVLNQVFACVGDQSRIPGDLENDVQAARTELARTKRPPS